MDGVDFWVGEAESIGIIGESDAARASPPSPSCNWCGARRDRLGTAVVKRKDGRHVDVFSVEANSDAMRAIRGDDISIIFQEPMTSFSPVHTIGDQIGEMLRLHTKLSPGTSASGGGHAGPRRHRQSELRFDEYPHQLSGACGSAP